MRHFFLFNLGLRMIGSCVAGMYVRTYNQQREASSSRERSNDGEMAVVSTSVSLTLSPLNKEKVLIHSRSYSF